MPGTQHMRSIPAVAPAPMELVARIEPHLTDATTELEILEAQVAALRTPAAASPVAEGGVQPKLLTVRQTAAVLGVGQSTVHNLVRTGELSSRKIGGARGAPVVDLDAFIARLPSRRLGA